MLDGDMHLQHMLPASKIITRIIVRLREVRHLLPQEELNRGDVVATKYGEIQGVLAPVCDLMQAMIIKVKVKASSIVGKWAACTSTKKRVVP